MVWRVQRGVVIGAGLCGVLYCSREFMWAGVLQRLDRLSFLIYPRDRSQMTPSDLIFVCLRILWLWTIRNRVLFVPGYGMESSGMNGYG